jgi:hypothetical protein
MTSPFEKMAAKLQDTNDQPIDMGWPERRREDLQRHLPGIFAVAQTIDTMRDMLLEGRVSTNLHVASRIDYDTLRPYPSVGSFSFNINPVSENNWQPLYSNNNGEWSPDTALHVGIELRDHYSLDNAARSPHPSGVLAVSLYFKTWGRLEEQQMTDILNSVEDKNHTYVNYKDQGFHALGTSIDLFYEAGTIAANDAEAILAPLSEHVIKAGQNRGGHAQGVGNFSLHKDVEIQDEYVPRRLWHPGYRIKKNIQKKSATTSLQLLLENSQENTTK